jgi:hypothetical protein
VATTVIVFLGLVTSTTSVVTVAGFPSATVKLAVEISLGCINIQAHTDNKQHKPMPIALANVNRLQLNKTN